MNQYQDRDWLEQKYWIEELSTCQIAELCGAGKNTIRYWMEKHNINFRTLSEALKGKQCMMDRIPWNKGKINKVTKIYKQCGNEFELYPSEPDKFCSKECYLEFLKIPGNHPCWKNRYTKIICKICGEIFEIRQDQILDTGNCCSKECQGINQKQTMKGENNYNFGKHLSEITKEKISKTLRGYKHTEETRKKNRESSIRNWQDPNYVKNVLRAINKRPTKPEKAFDEMTPDTIRYTGNRAWWKQLIDGKYHNPDFKVTGQDKVIEVFGDYWHREEDSQELIDLYAQAGVECLIFWEREIYNQPEVILEKASQFIEK